MHSEVSRACGGGADKHARAWDTYTDMYAIACTLPHMRTHLLAQLPIKVHGEISPYDDYHFDIVTLSGGYSGTSFAVENKSADMELELTLHFTAQNFEVNSSYSRSSHGSN